MAHHLSALDGRMDGVREVIWLDDIASPDGMLHYEDLTAYDMADDLGAANDETAGLFYTGGTTGRSKGVMLSHANLVVNAMNAVAGMGFDSDTAYIHSGAMFHLADGASTFGVTLVGGRHAFVPRFEPVEVLQTIAGEKVTHAQFVPTMINMLVNHPRFGEFDISTLKLVLYGASPMPEGVLRKAIEVMAHVGMIHGYGMTEAAPIVTLLPARYTTLETAHLRFRHGLVPQPPPACQAHQRVCSQQPAPHQQHRQGKNLVHHPQQCSGHQQAAQDDERHVALQRDELVQLDLGFGLGRQGRRRRVH